jgi:CheY-like chemotaxis protein
MLSLSKHGFRIKEAKELTTHRILVVEDHHEVRRMLRAGLETLGTDIKVSDVPSGEEAMLVISRQPVDVMVVDVRLPGISGLELLERAQAKNPGLKLILITGVIDPQVRKQVSQAGAEAFFFKPLEMPDFLGAVERCLGLAHSTHAASVSQPAAVSTKPEPPAVVRSLSTPLSSLREVLKAACVLLFDDDGKVLARSGELPGASGEPELVSALLAAFSAGRKTTSLLGVNLPEDLLYIAGAGYDLFLAPVGPARVLALAVPNAPERPRMETVLHVLVPAVEDLLALLAEPVEGSRPPESEVGGTGGLRKLEAIFNQGQLPLKAGELDAFWDSAVEGGEGQGAINGDSISFDEARKLGLAPE